MVAATIVRPYRRYLKFIKIYRTGKFWYSIFLESRSVLGLIFFAYKTGASKYIKIVKNHYPANFKISKKIVLIPLRFVVNERNDPKVNMPLL